MIVHNPPIREAPDPPESPCTGGFHFEVRNALPDRIFENLSVPDTVRSLKWEENRLPAVPGSRRVI
jgi:hypothetical protein